MKKFSLLLSAIVLMATPYTWSANSGFNSDTKMKMQYKDTEITTLIETFAKASDSTFVVDPSVRGKISVFAPQPVGLNEGFDLLSTALALNGFAIVDEGGKYVVVSARNATRKGIPVQSEVPAAKPERMVTWITTLKNIPVDEANSYLRIFPSKDGEMTLMKSTNQLIVIDFATSVIRIAEALKQIDQPVSPAVQKIVNEAKRKGELAKADAAKRFTTEGAVPTIGFAPADAGAAAPKKAK